jgi:L-amino acid N-acyltransferase YncA
LGGFLIANKPTMSNNYTIRLVTPADAAGCLKVYAPNVLETASTFEVEVPDVDEFRARIQKISATHPWLVCENGDGEIVGYVYAYKHKERISYQWSVDATIYLAKEVHGRGLGRIMYAALFEILKLQGFVNIYANAVSTNAASNRLHQSMGFEKTCVYKNIGYKLGEWHTNNGYMLAIAEHVDNPPPPKSIEDVTGTIHFQRVLNEVNLKVNELTRIAI